MITDTQVAQNLVKLYAGSVGFKVYAPGVGLSGICYGLIETPEENQIYLRGSADLADWAHDLFAAPVIFPHETFGPVHAGFFAGMDRLANQISTKIDFSKPTRIYGHSLGAARARALTALFLENYQKNPAMLETVVFGEPLSGMQQLANFLKPVVSRSYRNGAGFFFDMVTTVPPRIPPLLWVRASKLIHVSQSPATGIIEEALDPFSFHHMPLYAAAVAKIAPLEFPWRGDVR